MTPTRFLIAGTPRSGSNWLVSALASHPDIWCDGELLDDPYLREHPTFAADPWLGLEQRRERAHAIDKAFGFKMFYFHCWAAHPEHRGIWDRLSDEVDLRVVLLTRTNLLALALSWTTAWLTRQWKLDESGNRVAPPPVDLEPAELDRRFAEIEEGVARLRARFGRHAHVDLTYERLFEHPESSLAAVQDLLGVARRPLRGHWRKQETRPLSEAIGNYDELTRVFAGTRHAAFF